MCSYVRCIYIYNCYIFFLDWSFDLYVLSFFISCDFLYFKVCFFLIWVLLLLISFNFHLHVISSSIPSLSVYICPWGLKLVSCKQHICESCFCIYSASPCLLVGTLNPFTFRVIMDKYIFIAILLIAFALLLWVFFSFFPSLVICWLFLVLCLDCFFFFYGVSIIVFWFAVPIRFGYYHLCVYRIVWGGGSFILEFIFNVLHLSSPLLMPASFDIIFVNGWFSIFLLFSSLPVSFLIWNFLFFSFFFFFWLHLRHMEVPRLRVKLELQLLAHATATVHARSELHLWPTPQLCQCWILNSLSEARDRTCKLMVPSQICFHCATMGTLRLKFSCF